MCVTTEVSGTHKLKGHERLDKLKSLNEDRSDQYCPPWFFSSTSH